MKNSQKKNYSPTKKIFILIIVLSPILYILLNIIKWPIYNYLLDEYSNKTRATIIDERNYKGKGVITEMYTYSYSFSVDGKKYEGDSKRKDLEHGSTIEIEYLDCYPNINRPLIINN